ncbi:Glycerate kinase [Caldicellulosiruptor saccharolyticus DSM 8903]|uniref:Glycerate kinase n=1 Tax=Caldicellulosiruptor saccharolyticus (strain ATCC 43494 / DSM 8903 / Tp8T 6331) TaxID=351627 RepID=A4XJ58_CALS8|nr:glycerate kinase [Caldicellulosiruptor saccharolyticus]ABP66943.1 Glycerate kinase [Caldicellulosiruptor saccharolyticus DSM 8903]
MKYLVAPDKYKGSFDASVASEIIKEAIIEVDKSAEVFQLPLADGGEGTLTALSKIFGAKIEEVEVSDPLFRKIKSRIGFFEDKAIIEMAECSGLLLLKDEERNPLYTTTYGVGELIKYAISKKVKEIIIGIGGSATNDAGVGMLNSLGMKFLDENGEELKPIGQNLVKIKKIDDSEFLKDALKVKFTVLCDVTNPLYGENGAAYVFAPQKGADENAVKLLDMGLRNFANVAKEYLGKDLSLSSGAGAAGGLGFALLAFLNAQYVSGIDYILSASNAEEHVKWADIIITGEGRFDRQSLSGKSTIGIATLGAKFSKMVIVISGSIDCPFEEYSKEGITSIFSIVDMASSLDRCLKEAPRLLKETTKSIVNLILRSKNL